MTDLTRLSAAELSAALADGTTSVEITTAFLDRITATNEQLNSFLHVDADGALATAADADATRARGEELPALSGVPIAVKDLINTMGQPTTAGSKMLDGWVPPYDATVVAKLRAAKLPILGKTNLDEFAMGSSNEHSAYGAARNPWDTERIPGGSSGGSAAAVAGFQTPLALGTDTGGSIRQPAAMTGIVGMKPTYGGVSRHGVIAMASSLDQVGPMARTVLDAALLHEVIAGHDPMDSTSINGPVPSVVEAARTGDVAGLKIGVITELNGEGFAPGVRSAFDAAAEKLSAVGAEIIELSCPSFEHGIAAYYLVMPSEVSSNLARFDAMRYGARVIPHADASADQVMAASRDAGFGDEVKRRIILGTYALSSGYYDAYYGSAQKVRTIIANDFAAAFGQVDVLMSPTAPHTAWKLGEKSADPLAMYLEDIATIPANLAGVPGLSVPVGLADGLPVGVQFLAPAKADERLYNAAAALEALIDMPRLEEIR